MNSFFSGLSKTAIAMLVIFGGVIFVLISDPPKDVCDSQLELFQKSLEGHLVPSKSKDKERDYSIKPRYDEYLTQCKLSNSPGGCFEWFEELKYLLGRIQIMGRECRRKAVQNAKVRATFWESLKLMNEIAWGEEGPELEMDKVGWFETADLNLFCKIKKRAKAFYGKETYDKFRRSLFDALPGAKEMDKREAYSKMLMSVRCSRYL